MAGASNAHNQATKKTKGRQKIEMKKIESEYYRKISFSGRKTGIFKKANELVSLTGVELAIGIFSESGKPYTFGSPSVDQVINRFLERNNVEGMDPQQRILMENRKNTMYNDLAKLFNDLRTQLGKDEKLKSELEKKEMENGGCSVNSISELGLEEVTSMIEKLKVNHGKLVEKMNEKSSASPSSAGNNN